ncbi:MAG: Crp/Fnr family transcriptional regulator [Bacteroidota bacterium]
MTLNPDNKTGFAGLNDNYKEILDAIRQSGSTVNVKKGESVLNQGDHCRFVFFVEEGCFRTFRVTDGKETTLGFSFSGDIDTCPYSFINRVPGFDTIAALRESRIIKIHQSDIDAVTESYPETGILTARLLSHYIEVLIQRLIDLKNENAYDLYLKLYQRQPIEVSEIPLKYIASYLGISGERLSRIRKELKLNNKLIL